MADQLAQIIGCTGGSMPFTHLGLPLGTKKATVLELMPLVNRIERKLTANL